MVCARTTAVVRYDGWKEAKAVKQETAPHFAFYFPLELGTAEPPLHLLSFKWCRND